MPSRFPGMDPFIEMDQWQEFHVNMVVEIQRQLVPLLSPKYVARVERRVYTEHLFDEVEIIQPDVEIVRASAKRSKKEPAGAAAAVAEVEPRLYAVPVPHQRSEPFVKIIDRGTGQVVTLIEFLSPGNKARGSDGFRAYYEKREEVLQSSIHLVEIDLLRGGTRLPTIDPLQETTDYCVFINRAPKRHHAEVVEWPLRHPLPAFPLPLGAADRDLRFDLQRTFASVFDGAGYERFIDYRVTLKPPLHKDDMGWVRKLISKHD
ncbi:MAG TPA: DUF4058 family protein [Pirellulaceae bacterium]|nr:DUF4058 family protein [Pirellulaceae bacterium]